MYCQNFGMTFTKWVLYLRHDFGKQEWESVCRIITFGWQKERHLPVKIAPVLLEQAVVGCVESDLMDNFLKYVSESEQVIVESCSDFASVDQEELLDGYGWIWISTTARGFQQQKILSKS